MKNKQNEKIVGKTTSADPDAQNTKPVWDGLMGWCVLEGIQ